MRLEAGAVAVGASLGSGYLAGAVGARRVLVAATAGQGLALLAYLVVRTPVAFVAVACAAVGLQAVQRTALSTMIAQSFVGPERVEVRARLRVVTNTFIGVGAGLAAVALAIDTKPAYLVAMGWTAAMLFVSAVPVRRLPVGGPADVPRVRGPRRSPLRDRTYLTAAALNAVMTMQFTMLTVGVPLWITGWTAAPTVTVAGLLASTPSSSPSCRSGRRRAPTNSRAPGAPLRGQACYSPSPARCTPRPTMASRSSPWCC